MLQISLHSCLTRVSINGSWEVSSWICVAEGERSPWPLLITLIKVGPLRGADSGPDVQTPPRTDHAACSSLSVSGLCFCSLRMDSLSKPPIISIFPIPDEVPCVTAAAAAVVGSGVGWSPSVLEDPPWSQWASFTISSRRMWL